MPAPEGMLRALGAGRDGLVVSPGGRGGGLGMPTLRNARSQAAARPLVYTGGVWRRLRGETRAAGVVAWVLTVLEAGVRIARSS